MDYRIVGPDKRGDEEPKNGALYTMETPLKKRCEQLRDIELMRQRIRNNVLGPRAQLAFLIGAAVCGVMMFVVTWARDSGLLKSAIPWVGQGYWLPFAIGLTALALVKLKSHRPETWDALLDAKLAEYDPILPHTPAAHAECAPVHGQLR